MSGRKRASQAADPADALLAPGYLTGGLAKSELIARLRVRLLWVAVAGDGVAERRSARKSALCAVRSADHVNARAGLTDVNVSGGGVASPGESRYGILCAGRATQHRHCWPLRRSLVWSRRGVRRVVAALDGLRRGICRWWCSVFAECGRFVHFIPSTSCRQITKTNHKQKTITRNWASTCARAHSTSTRPRRCASWRP